MLCLYLLGLRIVYILQYLHFNHIFKSKLIMQVLYNRKDSKLLS